MKKRNIEKIASISSCSESVLTVEENCVIGGLGDLVFDVASKTGLNVKIHKINGPHPSGNVGVQIHHIDPVNSGDRVWTLGAEDVAIIGRYFMTGIYNPIRTIAVSGPPVKYPKYYKTIVGTQLNKIIDDTGIDINDSLRIINGDVLSGRKVEHDNYLGFYNNTLSVLREGNRYRMFGWIPFVNNKVPSMYKTSFSWLFPNKEYDLDTNLNGE